MRRLLAAATLLLWGLTCGAHGQEAPDTWRSFEKSAPQEGVRLLPSRNEGATVERVFIHLRNPSGDNQRDDNDRRQIAETLKIRAGGVFSTLITDLAVRQVRQLPFVRTAEYQLYQASNQGRVILAVLVELTPLAPEAGEPGKGSRGMAVHGNLADFPTLYESDQSLYKIILNAGLGGFSETNAWFGSSKDFVAGAYQPKGTISWPETSIEAGVGGISQVGNLPAYVFGAASYLTSATLAPDIFRADTRTYGAMEKGYGGLLLAKKGLPASFSISGGRQNFQLNSNFLFGQVLGSANALERGASFLNARTAYDNAVLSTMRWGNVLLEGFYLDPDELPVSESFSRFKGVNIKFNDNKSIEAALAWINVPRSDSLYIFPAGQTRPRQGLQVLNPRLVLTDPVGLEGFWLEGEFAHEWNDQFPMSAEAGYLAAGYTFTRSRWRPQIRYRFAGFSGDNPSTSTYERFDSLRGGGLGDWLQGINLAKVYGNSNLLSHWLELELNPSRTLQFSLNYFNLHADQLNNLGARPVLAKLPSRDIGQEVMLVTRWSATPNLFVLGVTSLAFPGSAIRESLSSPTSPWYTLQLSLFLGF